MKLNNSFFSACGTCPAGGPTIGPADPNLIVVPFTPAAPATGVDANGCATLTYICTGPGANIDVSDKSHFFIFMIKKHYL